MNVEVIRTPQQLADLAPVWDDLVERAGMSHPFVTHAWIQTWWESFGSDAELMIVLVRDGSHVVGIAPLQRMTTRIYGARHRCVRFLANDHSPRCDFIVDARHPEVYAAICSFLMSEPVHWDILQLCDVPADSPALNALTSHASHHGLLTGMRRAANSPFVSTTSDWTEYMNTLPAKRRWFLRNRLKRLSRLGHVGVEAISGGDKLQSALEDGFRLEAAAWKGKAGTAIQCSDSLRHFYTRLAERFGRRGWLRLQFLTLDGKRIAFAYCVAYERQLILLKPGFDPEYAEFSPGNLLVYLALQELHESDFVAYDFGGYDDHWKRQWTSQTVAHNTVFFYAPQPLTRLDHYTRFALMPKLRRARNLVLGQLS